MKWSGLAYKANVLGKIDDPKSSLMQLLLATFETYRQMINIIDVPIIAKSPTSVRKIQPDATIDCCMNESDVAVIRTLFYRANGKQSKQINDQQRRG